MFKKTLLFLLLALILIQFIPVDFTAPAVDPNKDFLMTSNIADDNKRIVKDACYDCHSYETAYPWYSKIQPAAWWMNGHIQEGREHLNFSTWTDYEPGKKDHKLEECAEEVQERHMPLKSYLLTHPEAKLSDAQVQSLADLFESLR